MVTNARISNCTSVRENYMMMVTGTQKSKLKVDRSEFMCAFLGYKAAITTADEFC